MKKNRWLGMVTVGLLMAASVTGCAGRGAAPAATGTGTVQEQNNNWFAGLDTVDIEGNPVTKDLFAENDLTLINVWATFCGPCIREMPELEELHQEYRQQEYEGKKVGIIGLLVDSSTADIVAGLSDEERKLAKEIIEQTGVTYPQILVSDALAQTEFKRIAQFPTTYLVDKDGAFVGEAIAGARTREEWKQVIEEYLQKVQVRE